LEQIILKAFHFHLLTTILNNLLFRTIIADFAPNDGQQTEANGKLTHLDKTNTKQNLKK